jgi:hypothetical protein
MGWTVRGSNSGGGEIFHTCENVRMVKVGLPNMYSVSVYLVYLFTTVGLTPGGSSTVHIDTEQHSETEYTECYIHNNKNT